MYDSAMIRKVQLRLLDMAKEIKAILERHNIPYFITYGTLLGAVRHKGFIPWDDDFDFYLFSDSFDVAIEYLRQELPSNRFVEDRESEPLFFHGWAHVKDTESVAECELYPQDSCYTHRGISIDLYKTTMIHECSERWFRVTEHIKYLKRRMSVALIDAREANLRLKKLTAELKNIEEGLNVYDFDGRMMWAFPSTYNDRMFPEELFPLKKYQFEDTCFYGPNNSDVFLRRCYGNYLDLPPIDKRHPHYSDVTFLT